MAVHTGVTLLLLLPSVDSVQTVVSFLLHIAVMQGFRAICAAVMVLASCLNAPASVLLHLDLQELSRRSDFVVVGTVTDMNTITINGIPWTVATLSVHDSWLKTAPASLRVMVPGGVRLVHGRMLMTRVDGAPVLSRLQKAVFFLRGKAAENLQLVGWEQGYWTVRSEAAGTREVAVSGDESIAPVQWTIEELRARVQKARRLQ